MMPEMTEEALNELERLALAATPGKRDFFSDGIWTLDDHGYADFNILWVAEDMNGRHYVGVHEDDVEILTIDRETVLALVKALREAWQTIALLKELYFDWRAGALTDGAAQVALGLTVAPPEPSEADMEWARRTVRELGLEDEARAILESAEPVPPRTCPRCGWGALDEDDACVECGFVLEAGINFQDEED